jgi:hypothetical protein
MKWTNKDQNRNKESHLIEIVYETGESISFDL